MGLKNKITDQNILTFKMSEFLLVFWRDYQTREIQPSPEQLKAYRKLWADWLRSLAANDKLSRPARRISAQGKVIGSRVTNGPYTEVMQSVKGLLFLKAANYNEAVEMAGSCPILQLGGRVEIRQGL